MSSSSNSSSIFPPPPPVPTLPVPMGLGTLDSNPFSLMAAGVVIGTIGSPTNSLHLANYENSSRATNEVSRFQPNPQHFNHFGVASESFPTSASSYTTPVPMPNNGSPKVVANELLRGRGASSKIDKTKGTGAIHVGHSPRRRRQAPNGSGARPMISSVERRNARERTRVHTVNQAFVVLKRMLPSLAKNAKRVSKLKILRASISYIHQLLRLLGYEVPTKAAAGEGPRRLESKNCSELAEFSRGF